jgi:hypothetical protein
MTPKLKYEGFWEYLSYATVSDIWGEVKDTFIAWIIWSILTLIFGAIFEFASEFFKPFLPDVGSNSIPKWFWLTAVFSDLLWFMRGETVTFPFPQVGWKSWLFLSLLFLAMFFVMENATWWVAMPFLWAIMFSFSCLDALAAKGKENFLRISGAQRDDL